jgi:hypothetical protein
MYARTACAATKADRDRHRLPIASSSNLSAPSCGLPHGYVTFNKTTVLLWHCLCFVIVATGVPLFFLFSFLQSTQQLTPTHYFPPLLPQLDNYPLTTTTVPHITIAPTSKQVTASI